MLWDWHFKWPHHIYFNAPLRWHAPLMLFLCIGILWIISWSFKESKEVSQLLSTLSFWRELHSCCSSNYTILWMDTSWCGHPKREFIYWSKCCPTLMWSSNVVILCLNDYLLYCHVYAVHSPWKLCYHNWEKRIDYYDLVKNTRI